MLRPAPRSASIGSVRVANHAGAAPNTMPVTSARPNAKARTIGAGRTSIGRKVAPAKASASSRRAAHDGDDESREPRRRRREGRSRASACVTICRRDAPIGQPHGGLAAPGDGAGEQQVRHVGAGDQEHQPAHAEENLEAASVLLFHDADAGAGRHHRDDLLGQDLDDGGHPVRRIARVVLHPLMEDAGESRAHAVRRRAWTQPADHAQPRGDRLTVGSRCRR